MMENSTPPGCDWRFLSVRKTLSCPNAWIHQAWNQHQLHHPNVPCCLMATYPTCLKQGLSEARVKNKPCQQQNMFPMAIWSSICVESKKIKHQTRNSWQVFFFSNFRHVVSPHGCSGSIDWQNRKAYINSSRSFQIDVEMPIAPPTMLLSLVSPKLKWKPTGCQLETTPRL